MRVLIKFLLLLTMPLVWSCAAMTIPAHFTYQAVDEVPLPQTGSGIVALDTGETIDVSSILASEGKRPTQLLMHKIEGVFVLVGEGFKNLYIVYPKGDKADVDLVPLAGAPNGAEQPKLRAGVASKCTLLT